MQDNITALNIEEGYKTNKTIKVVPGKHAKPAKLSSGQTFKTKTAAIMEKVNAPAPIETPAPQEAAPQAPEPTAVAAPTPEVAPAAPVPPPTAPAPQGVDLPTDDIVLSKITNLNIAYVEPTNAKDAGSRRLKISSAVVTRTGNALKVMVNNAPVVETPAPEAAAVAPAPQTLGEATPAPVPEVPTPSAPAPEVAAGTETPDAMMTPDSGFFLGQKLNTETNENGETELTPTLDTETEEVSEEVEEEVPEITQEEKDERLNQILNDNQGNVVDFSAAKKALEELADRRNAINQLNREMEEARRIRESQNQELQQLLAEAPRMLDDLDKEKMSRTEELSNLRAEIIQYDDLIKQNRGFQGNQDEYDEEISYGRSRG